LLKTYNNCTSRNSSTCSCVSSSRYNSCCRKLSFCICSQKSICKEQWYCSTSHYCSLLSSSNLNASSNGSVIPSLALFRCVIIAYRKQMKRGYSKLLYNQRNKDETILSVIKRLFGEHITSRLVRTTQNRELCLRCIAYNMHRLTNLVIILVVSTEPYNDLTMQISFVHPLLNED
jgi:hypothetical protein